MTVLRTALRWVVVGFLVVLGLAMLVRLASRVLLASFALATVPHSPELIEAASKPIMVAVVVLGGILLETTKRSRKRRS